MQWQDDGVKTPPESPWRKRGPAIYENGVIKHEKAYMTNFKQWRELLLTDLPIAYLIEKKGTTPMKLKTQEKKQRTVRPNKNRVETPAVLTATETDVIPPPEGWLPDDTVEAPPGPETDIAATAAANENIDEDKPIVSYDTTAEDLMAASTGRYEDIPPQDPAEAVAAQIVEEAGFDTVREQETLVAKQIADDEAPAEQKIADATYNAVNGAGEALRAALEKFSLNLKTTATYVGLKLVRYKNDSWDFIKKTGNQVLAAYDKFRKDLHDKKIERRAKDFAEIAEYLKQPLEDFTEVFNKEMRRQSKRLTDLEGQLSKTTKSTNNALKTTSDRIKRAVAVDTTQLAEFGRHLVSGSRMKAIEHYRAMTGVDLAAATLAVEGMVAA